MPFIRPLTFGNTTTSNNLILAPLAGYSHKTTRIINRRYGAGYAITEMVSIEGILRDSQKTLRYADISDAPHLTSIQLFGKDSPENFAKASKILQGMFPVQSININFGCPMPKVLKNGGGSRLLDEPQKITDIIHAVKDTGVSVEAKIRCGFSYDNLDNILSALDRSDVDIIMLHCRLTSDKFLHGTANWDFFKRARNLTSKLLIANGDIKTPEDALKIFRDYQVDGLMIGRAAIGKPYLFQQISDYCTTGTYHIPNTQELLSLLKDYIELWFEITQSENIMPLRGTMMSLLSGFDGASEIRTHLAKTKTLDDVHQVIATCKQLITQD